LIPFTKDRGTGRSPSNPDYIYKSLNQLHEEALQSFKKWNTLLERSKLKKKIQQQFPEALQEQVPVEKEAGSSSKSNARPQAQQQPQAASSTLDAASPAPPAQSPPPSAAATPSSAAPTPPGTRTEVEAALAAEGQNETYQAVVSQPSAPQPPKPPTQVLNAFLQRPEMWHTPKVGGALTQQVAQAMMENRMFSVWRTKNGAVQFELLDATCSVADADSEPQFGNFLLNHGLPQLLQSAASRADPRNPVLWPPGFAQMKLEYVAQGTFNSIWRSVPGTDYESLNVYPTDIARGLTAGKIVLRAALPGLNERSSAGWQPYNAVFEEMVNMATAAANGYGPRILAMGWFARSAREGDEGYKLYAFLERGTMDLEARVKLLSRTMTALPDLAQKRIHMYFDNLLRTIYGYSADRCVFVDAKLRNFIDTYGPGQIYDAPAGINAGEGTVRVIDVAGDGFRRMYAMPRTKNTELTQEGLQAQGWRLYWLHNVLVISCCLRVELGYNDFLRFWWNKIYNAILAVATELALGVKYQNDIEYLTAAEFIGLCKWEGTMYTGSWQSGKYAAKSIPPSDAGNRSVVVAEACRRFATYYFFDALHQMAFVNYATPILKALQAKEDPTKDPHQKEQLSIAATRASEQFDNKFRLRFVPMLRHFREHFRPNPPGVMDPMAKTLVGVMLDYCRMPEEELMRRYVHGSHPSRTWTQVPKLRENVPLLRAQNASDQSVWERLMGFSNFFY
jgi:hypothetical protein